MIVHSDRFTFGQNKYLLDFGSFRFERNMARLDVIWFTRQHGRVAVHSGGLVNMHQGNHTMDVDDLLASSQTMVYGSDFKWNGIEMWSASNNFHKEMEAFNLLDPIREIFPNVPENYTGWYGIA